jgi:xylulokinase
MSLLGIDIGTTGCKASIFSIEGDLLATAYAEYDVQRPQAGWAQLDADQVWERAKNTIRKVTIACGSDPVTALSVSSLGEAMVPVSRDRRVLGPSLLNFDLRGLEYLPELQERMPSDWLYRVNGNALGNHFSLTKLKWIKDNQPDLYRQADSFLLWSSFIAYMLGAKPAVDYSLANRTLLFDLEQRDWSDELIDLACLDREKLPEVVPTGMVVGQVSDSVGEELNLSPSAAIVSGAHDQCACAVGCGVTRVGSALYSMGTFLCAMPVFDKRREPQDMLSRGLNTEHHPIAEKYVCFIYNQGGSLLKWYRDTFAARDHQSALSAGRDIYAELIAEMPPGPGQVVVLPHFAPTGPPHFLTQTSGVMTGLHLETKRGEILKGILEGVTFYIKACLDTLPETGISITDFRAAGGGCKSEAWLQLSADILGRPFHRPRITEAGTLGGAILAGSGSGIFPTIDAGVNTMVRLERTFEPDYQLHEKYTHRFELYQRLWPALRDILAD